MIGYSRSDKACAGVVVHVQLYEHLKNHWLVVPFHDSLIDAQIMITT
jgi:hypothetical protein